MTTADRMLAVARSQLGVGERSDGTSKYGSWYTQAKPAPGFEAGAWCQMFLSWCANEVGAGEDVVPRMAYTPYAVAWFKARGRWGAAPRRGALVYFNWPGGDLVDHVGIVEAVRQDGSIVTIEGNMRNAVRRCVRRYGIAGYGYPDYTARNWTEALVDELPLLKRGAEKTAKNRPHIKTVFYLLAARGFPMPDGVSDVVFGDPLAKRVKEFQAAKKLKVDGEVGPKTWAELVIP